MTVLKVNDSTVYLTDNGAALCGAHLGYTARVSGRDLSGQPILPVTPDVARAAKEIADESFVPGFFPVCEVCGRAPALEE